MVASNNPAHTNKSLKGTGVAACSHHSHKWEVDPYNYDQRKALITALHSGTFAQSARRTYRHRTRVGIPTCSSMGNMSCQLGHYRASPGVISV